MNYKIEFTHKQGLADFIKKFKQAYIEDEIKFNVSYNDTNIIVDDDFIVSWSEYKIPEFEDVLKPFLELNISNEGIDATCFMLDFYN